MNLNEALNKCMHLCSKKEYCKSEIESKLKEWELTEEQISEVLAKLAAGNYINELRFAKAFTNDKFKFNHWGKVKIRYQLKQKKIPTDIINQALEPIDDLTYQKVIFEEINKKSKTTIARNEFESKGKIARFVIAKGFEPEIVFNLLHIEN